MTGVRRIEEPQGMLRLSFSSPLDERELVQWLAALEGTPVQPEILSCCGELRLPQQERIEAIAEIASQFLDWSDME